MATMARGILAAFLCACALGQQASGETLAWPVRSCSIRGGYGDIRIDQDTGAYTFHPSVDLHTHAWSPVFGVKADLTISAVNYWAPSGDELQLATATERYRYSHMVRGYNAETGLDWYVGDIIPDTSTSFGWVYDWGSDGMSWTDHLDFKIYDGWLSEAARNNPIWANSEGYEYLPCGAAQATVGDSLAFGVYNGPGEWVEECPGYANYDYSTDNHYFRRLKVVSGAKTDVMVRANTQRGDGTGPAGVCVLKMAVEEGEDPSSQHPPWQYAVDLRKGLPDATYAKRAFAIEWCYWNPEGQSPPVIPRTQWQLADGDTMWYVVTNFNSQGEFQDGYLNCSDSDSARYWVWLEADNHLGDAYEYGPIRFEMHPGPAADDLMYLTASEDAEGILLSWRVWPNPEIRGFCVSRSDSVSGQFDPIPGSWVPYQFNGRAEDEFAFLDTSVLPARQYWYRLECYGDGDQWRYLGPTTPAVWQGGAPQGNLVVVVTPNPFVGSANIEVKGPGAVGVSGSLQIFDLLGRMVWRSPVPGDPSASFVMWDGVDQGGAPVAPGIYVCRVERGGQRRVIKVTRIE